MKINFLPDIRPVSSVINNIRTGYSTGIQTLKRDTFGSFKYLKYEKCNNLTRINKFLAQNFSNTFMSIHNIPVANEVLQSMCYLHNMTKGRIKFPPIIEFSRNKKSNFAGDYADGVIRILSVKNVKSTFAHEVAHYNHELLCKDYLKMGTESELIEDGITDFSIYNEFQTDKSALRIIKSYLGEYAASSPCEFVACTFESLANNRILPNEVWELYDKYEGPLSKYLKPLFTK